MRRETHGAGGAGEMPPHFPEAPGSFTQPALGRVCGLGLPKSCPGPGRAPGVSHWAPAVLAGRMGPRPHAHLSCPCRALGAPGDGGEGVWKAVGPAELRRSRRLAERRDRCNYP